ncbi:MAG: hypothetical protein ACKVQW_06995 [Pyrinomonadaceae bacterium]
MKSIYPIIFVILFSVPALAQNTDRLVAARFAPVFYQALGDNPRSDYITNLDFDGDWIGINNWKNVDNMARELRAYVYYSVTETQTHYFIHYAVFHPRDYKGGSRKGVLFSELIKEGVKIASRNSEPTGLMAEAGVAHENDMEGALVVVDKKGASADDDAPAFVETLAHNNFLAYVPTSVETSAMKTFKTEGQNVLLFIEPKGHGIEAYSGDEKQKATDLLTYKFGGRAGDPAKSKDSRVDYELVPIQTTLWARARIAKPNATFGVVKNLGTVSIDVIQNGKTVAKKFTLGSVGIAFDGDMGGKDMARPPWAWFDKDRRNEQLGLWFFDPAKVIKRDFNLPDSFSTVYVKLPFWAAN